MAEDKRLSGEGKIEGRAVKFNRAGRSHVSGKSAAGNWGFRNRLVWEAYSQEGKRLEKKRKERNQRRKAHAQLSQRPSKLKMRASRKTPFRTERDFQTQGKEGGRAGTRGEAQDGESQNKYMKRGGDNTRNGGCWDSELRAAISLLALGGRRSQTKKGGGGRQRGRKEAYENHPEKGKQQLAIKS